MKQAMLYFFILLYYLLSELIYQVAVYQEQGLVRYMIAPALCIFTRLILAVPTIRLLGVWVGIIFTVADFFSFSHLTLGWIFTVPTLFTKDSIKYLKHVEFDCAMLPIAAILAVILSIVSFFFPYQSVANELSQHLLMFVIISVIGFIFRMIVTVILKRNN